MDGRRHAAHARRMIEVGALLARLRPWLSGRIGPWWPIVFAVYGTALAASIGAPRARALGIGPGLVGVGMVGALAYAAWRIHRSAGVTLRDAAPSLLVSLVVALLIGRSLELPAERFHILIYGALGFALALAIRTEYRGGAGWMLWAAAAIGLGTWDEVLQGLLPNRYYGASDVFLNWVSAAVGALASLPLVARLGTRRSRREAPVRTARAVIALSLLSLALVEIPTFERGAIQGAWRGTNRCGWIETLSFDPERVLRWSDDRGHTARGEWRVTSNLFHEYVLDMHVIEDTNDRPATCGLSAGPPWDGWYADPLVLEGGELWLGPRRNSHFTRVP